METASKREISIKLVWILSHNGITENKEVHKEAKTGTQELINGAQIPKEEIKQQCNDM